MALSVFGYSVRKALLGAAICIGMLLVVPPLTDWKSRSVIQLAELKDELKTLDERSEQFAEELAGVQDDEIGSLKWQAEEIGVATARIQARVSEKSSASGMALRSISPTEEGDLEGVKTVTFRLEAEASLDHLAQFLRTLEYAQPVVLVNNANFRRLNRPGADGPQPVVFVQMDLSAPIDLASEVSQ